MGVYIPGIKPPKDEPGAFKVIVMYVGADGELRAECEGTHEVVPVPPHGRLIDADVLIDAIIAKYIRHERNRELVFAAAEIKQDLADIINELPTIIPAEDGER